MPISRSLFSLRNVLVIDAASCVASGALLTVLSVEIGNLTLMPPAFLFYAGLLLFPVAAFMAAVARRAVMPSGALRLIVAGNVLWVAGSVLLPAGGLIAPNGLGWSFIIVQAIAVAVLAALEYEGLRETSSATTRAEAAFR